MIGAVRHAIHVLDCFTVMDNELGVTDIAEQLNMNVSTIHHVVTTLHNEGVLVKTQNRKYRLGPKILEWSHVSNEQYSPYYIVFPYLEALVKKVGETAYLSIIENDHVTHLAKVKNKRPIHIETNLDIRKPLHCTSAGKVLLAFQTRKKILSYLNKDLESRTPNTINDEELLLKELRKIRRQNFATDIEEYELGITSISAPITNIHLQVVCSITIQGPTERIKEKFNEIKNNVKNTANLISSRCDLL